MALAWTAYQSFNMNSLQTVFYVFGLLPIHIVMTPLFILTTSPFFLPPMYSIINLTSIITGYTLIGGMIAVLPNFFWTMCFYLDIIVYLVWIYFERDRQDQLLAIESEARALQIEESSHGGAVVNDEEALLSRNRDSDIYTIGNVDIIEDRISGRRTSLVDLFNSY